MMMALEETYHNLAVHIPLEPDDPKLCLEVFSGSMKRVEKRLLLESATSKMLLSGHTGCGKTTFLNYLAACTSINEKFFIIKYSIKDILNPEDISHIDILLSVGIQALNQAVHGGLELAHNQRFGKEVDAMAKLLLGDVEMAKSREESRNIGAEVEAGIEMDSPSFFLKFFTKFRGSFKVDQNIRSETREKIKGKVQDLIQIVNAILGEIKLACRQPVLLILDDTDKLSPPQAQDIFFKNGQDLSAITAAALFVVNMDVVCSGHYRAILDKIGYDEFLPAMKVYDREGNPSESTAPYRERMEKLLRKRIEPDRIEPGTIELLVKFSGGVSREAVRLANSAVFNALVGNREVVSRSDVESARLKIRNEFSLTKEKLEILREILRQPDWMPGESDDVDQPDSPFLELINTLGVIEYRNEEDKWRRPHPVLADWTRIAQS